MKLKGILMSRLLVTVLLALVVVLSSPRQYLLAATENLIEQVTINSAQKTPTYASTLLQSGATYRIEVSGVYFNGSTSLADAECRSDDGWVIATDSGPILDLLVVYGSAIGTSYLNSAQGITAQDVNWGPCATSHVYSLTVTGNGGNIGFVVSDEFWGDPGVWCSSSFCQNNGTSDNSGSLTVNIFQEVIYNFSGFFQPVDNQPTLNSVKAGRAIPIKFSLGGDQGLSIFASGYPASRSVACGTAAPDAIEETVTAGASSLSYDAATDQYTYVWKTDKGWVGTCRTLVVKLNDNTFHYTNFQFK